jgi:hypothetical protein
MAVNLILADEFSIIIITPIHEAMLKADLTQFVDYR